VSTEGKRPGKNRVRWVTREMNASEPLMTCRKRRNGIKTGTESLSREEQGRNLFRTLWSPALRWHDWVTRQLSGTWEPSALMLTEPLKQQTCQSVSRNAARRGGTARSSSEVSDKEMEPRGRDHEGWFEVSTGNRRNP
jgi:hypothetical protein